MSNFTIEYAFVALDRFSETAAKISQEIKSIQASLMKTTEASSVAQASVNKFATESNILASSMGNVHASAIKGSDRYCQG